MSVLIAGLNVGPQSSAAVVDGSLAGVCAQERVLRVRSLRGADAEMPTEALDLLLQRLGRAREDIHRCVSVGPHRFESVGRTCEHVDHHEALACTAYLSSPYSAAAIVVCDHAAPGVSVWIGNGPQVTRLDWPWTREGFADVYARAAGALGFFAETGSQRFEALARLAPDARDVEIDRLLALDADGVAVDAGFERRIENRLAGHREPAERAAVAASIQSRIAELLLEWLGTVRRRTHQRTVCLAGALFQHSSLNTRARTCGLFDDVFVPVDPGRAGLSVGGALRAMGRPPAEVSPFLGPRYSQQETKDTLDNCKLHYSWESEDAAIEAAVGALERGTLVAWFESGMEWGPRALGARSILANPKSPYVLENLNRFLKRREPWRGYALSGVDEAVPEHFAGPGTSPFMECDFLPREPGQWRHILPSATAAVRVQTVTSSAPPGFRRLLGAFGDATGLPFLVNTSFNGFQEPMVCSPRDAVRVFFGTGIDMLVLNQFLLTK